MKKILQPLFERLVLKTFYTLVSVKFLILVTATVFYSIGHLTENSWKEIALVLAGIRSVDKIAGNLTSKASKTGG